MKNFKIALLALSTSSLITACSNSSGSAPEATGLPDHYSQAVAMAPTVGFVIPTDLTYDCYFNQVVISNGTGVTAYQNSSVPFGQQCKSEQRLCQSGALSGSYNYATCDVGLPASCLFNGQTIASGQSVQSFASSNVASGQTCSSEIRTCNNGVLSGSNSYSTCVVDQPASCLFNGQTLASGQSIEAYNTSTVAFGQSCSLEYRTCQDGVLSGSNQYATCAIDQPASCLFNGQTLASGESVNAFLNSNVSFGNSCSSEVRTCNNGVLSGSSQFGSCVVDQPASCLFNGQTINHGASITAYLQSTSDYGQMCSGEIRSCDNGHLSGSYQFASCDNGQAASCLFNGQTIISGDSVTAYASSTVSVGGSCGSEVRTCSNGVLSGTNQFASCAVDQPASCLFNGQTIASGQSVVAYKNAQVEKNLTCEAETRLCSNGQLSGSFSNNSCVVLGGKPTDDDEDDDIIKICKIVVDIKHKEHYSEHHNEGLHLGWYKHKERFNCGKKKGWFKVRNKEEEHDCDKHSNWYKDKDKNKDSDHDKNKK